MFQRRGKWGSKSSIMKKYVLLFVVILLTPSIHGASLQSQLAEEENLSNLSRSKDSKFKPANTSREILNLTPTPKFVTNTTSPSQTLRTITNNPEAVSSTFNPADQFLHESREINDAIKRTKTPGLVLEDKDLGLKEKNSSADFSRSFLSEKKHSLEIQGSLSTSPSTLSYSSLPSLSPLLSSLPPAVAFSSTSSPPFTMHSKRENFYIDTSENPKEESKKGNQAGKINWKANLSKESRNIRPKVEGKVAEMRTEDSFDEKLKATEFKGTFTPKKEKINELGGNDNEKNEIREDPKAYKDIYPKVSLPDSANNKLEDPFLTSLAEILSKNISERISEIIYLRNKPEKFLAALKAAQQLDNFEDPFRISPILHESNLDKLLATDSSAFNEGQRKFSHSSFRGVSNEPRRYKSRKKLKNESSEIWNKNPEKVRISNKTIATGSKDNPKELHIPLDIDVIQVSNKFKELYAGHKHEMIDVPKNNEKIPVKKENKIIYEEISSNLHIDTSIDDIKDESESPEKLTENSEEYFPPSNASKSNFLDPDINAKVKEFELNDTDSFLSTTTNLPTGLDVNEKQSLNIFSSSLKDDQLEIKQSTFVTTSKSNTDEWIYQSISNGSTFSNQNIQSTIDVINNLSSTPPTFTTTTAEIPSSNLLLKKNHSNFIKDNDVLIAARQHDGHEDERGDLLANNDLHQEDTDTERYYSFFGYKDRLNQSLERSTGSHMSVNSHNEKVLESQAERMLQVMDLNADPCDDFYEFACGKWSKVYPLEDKALDNTFDRLREGLDEVLKLLLEEPMSDEDINATKVAKTLYRGCMNEEQIENLGVAPLKALLKELGGWPVIEGDAWKEKDFDWVELMAKLRTYNNDIILSEWVAADITNSSNHIIQLDQPELGLPSREYFLSAGDQNYRMAYMELMLKICELLGADPPKALEDMINVLQFEKQLAKILTPAEERRNLSAVHRRLSVEELREEIPEINWNKYFEIVSTLSAHSPPKFVIVFAMKYIQKLVTLIQTTSKRTVSNYLMWRFVKNRMNNLGRSALEAKQEFVRILFGSKSRPERWLTCVSYVNGNLGYVLGALFVKKYYPESSKNDSEEMIRLIRESFVEAINEASWMDEETRKVAESKVFAMVRNIGYPGYILNDTYMDAIYSELNFNESDHFWNVIKMLQFHARTTHNLLLKPVNRTDWTTTPAVVNAYYSRSKNMIMFPAGILQPPFYHPAFPRCLNFGGIGVVIGHEISHGFDDRGRQFDELGNLQQWWTEEDVSNFYDRATCMLDQYSRYKVESVGLKINAVNTLGENIADNAGLKIAYKAYQRWKSLHDGEQIQLPKMNLTHDQLFFLNFGQIWCEENSPEAMLTKLRGGQHSPNKFRVIGTLSNSKEFSEAFNCEEKSQMNPEEKCQVW